MDGFVSTMASDFRSVGRQASQMGSAMQSGINSALGRLRSFAGQARSALGSLGGVLRGAGQSLISGLVDGIQSMFGRVHDVLRNLTNQLPNWKGPKSVDEELFRPIGVLLMSGLKRGLQEGFGDATSWIGGAVSDLTDNVLGQQRQAAAAAAAKAAAQQGTPSTPVGHGAGATINIYDNDPSAAGAFVYQALGRRMRQ